MELCEDCKIRAIVEPYFKEIERRCGPQPKWLREQAVRDYKHGWRPVDCAIEPVWEL